MFNIFAHDYAEKAKIARMAMAAGYGLDPNITQPFPQMPSTSTTINMAESTQKSGTLGKAIGVAAIAGGLLLGGGLGGAALLNAFRSAPAIAPAMPMPNGYDIEVPWTFDGGMRFDEPKITPVK